MMKSSRLSVVFAIVAAVVLAGQANAQFLDDRTLLWARGAPPNVLVILDSGATMTHDPETNSLNYIACGDDEGSKLYQAKEVLSEFVTTFPDFRMGFSYYEKTAIEVHYLNFIYAVKSMIDVDGNGIPETPQGPMLDGTLPGDYIRMGSAGDPNHSSAAQPIFPIRYGQDGDQEYMVQLSGNPSAPQNGDRRVRSYLVTSTGVRKVAGSEPFYYPAYFWGHDGVEDGLSWGRWMRMGLEGSHTWEEVAEYNHIDTSDPSWREIVHAYALADIMYVGDPWGEADLDAWIATATSNQIGSETLWIYEQEETYRNDTKVWVTTDTQTTEVEYVKHFVLYDHPIADSTNLGTGHDTLAAVEYQGNADCAGYLDEGSKMPIVDIPTDDSNNRHIIDSYLGPQTDPVFYFPHHGGNVFVPDVREEYIPLTETVAAAGRRPIKDTLNEAEFYFVHDIFNRPDEFAVCRKNFVLLITDGVETCSNLNAPCVAARGLGADNIAVFVIGFGPEAEVNQNVLSCVASESGGQFFAASNADELRAALRRIGLEVERRVRGFSSPVVPSVQSSTEQVAFIATFLPSGERSIWEGHLHAYLIDPLTGNFPVTIEGIPDTSQALWNAGEVLVNTNHTVRRMYYGQQAGAIPGTRYELRYNDADAAGKARLRALIEPSLTDTDLETVINFIRGDRDAPTYEGGKLGDIFHSYPQVIGAPTCFTCYLQNQHEYRTVFRDTHKKRRQVLFFGANDGGMHAFDAGVWDATNQMYDTGTGEELFAWVPSEVMPVFDNLAFDVEHNWTVDGTPTIADVFIDPSHNGTPSTGDREWRSVVLFGERRGGRSVVCLDITQPDTYGADGDPNIAADRSPGCPNGGAGCSGEWPSLRWELKDLSDEDGNLRPDLGQTWSRPLVGFVRVIDATDPQAVEEERSVAFFGGGWDPAGTAGNFFYIVDIETGSILFKENVFGMVPGQAAATDLDLDGFFERVYFGTTAGDIWRLDLDDVGEIDATGRVANWSSTPFFQAGPDQPFYLEPTLVPVTFDATGEAVVAVFLGSGNRANIFERNVIPNRFYAVVDWDNGLLVTEADLLPNSMCDLTNPMCLGSDPTSAGYYRILDEEEKVNTPALVIDQKVVFSTFTPSDEIIVIEGKCKLLGNARTYVLGSCCLDGTYVTHPEPAVYATDPQLYVGADGKMHTKQMLDDQREFDPLAAWQIPLRVYSWKEQ